MFALERRVNSGVALHVAGSKQWVIMHQLDVPFMAKFMSMLVSVYLIDTLVSVIWHDRSGNHRHKQPPHKTPAAQERHERGGGAALSGSLICDRSAAGVKASPRLVGQPKWGNCSWHEAPGADRWMCARSESCALSTRENLLLLFLKNS